MFTKRSKGNYRHLIIEIWPYFIAQALFFACASLPAYAQGFVSGSTGADGAFSPTASQAVQVPASGVFNFTTINIPSSVTITFIRNATNTPVTVLATGNVTIAGAVNVDGQAGGVPSGGNGGPGGFRGGQGGLDIGGLTTGITGDGPGGGNGGSGNSHGSGGGFATPGSTAGGQGGPTYGVRSLLPLIGGSGGGGGGSRIGSAEGGGGGGGGAILIASSGDIVFNSTGSASISASGGSGGFNGNTCGGGGSGGAIRLITNLIEGRVSLIVNGGGSVCGGIGGQGYIRIEAFDTTRLNVSATQVTSFATPQPSVLINAPSLRIASVGGIAAPASPKGSFSGQPDISLPSSVSNPVNVLIEASNIPVSTAVDVTLTPEIGTRVTVPGAPLSGTLSASTSTAAVSIPATGVSVITATASVILTSSANPLLIDSERVQRIDIVATFGGASELTYVTQSGRRIKGVGQ